MLVLTIESGANRYAIDVARVIELVPKVELRTIPCTPAFVAGLLAYRGQVIPVLDLSVFFEGHPSCESLSTRIIVVDDARDDSNSASGLRNTIGERAPSSFVEPSHAPRLLGLIGEQVIELTRLRPEQFIPAPALIPRVPFLDKVAQTEGRIVQLIAVERIREVALTEDILDKGLESSDYPSKAEAETADLKSLGQTD